jgi:hypothetical protein
LIYTTSGGLVVKNKAALTGILTTNSGGSKLVFGGLAGVEASYSGLCLGCTTPDFNNYALAGDATTTYIRGGGIFQFTVGFNNVGSWTATGLSLKNSVFASARLFIPNQTTAANTAPIKIDTSATALMTTPEPGSIEVLADSIFYTNKSGVRGKLYPVSGGSATTPAGSYNYVQLNRNTSFAATDSIVFERGLRVKGVGNFTDSLITGENLTIGNPAGNSSTISNTGGYLTRVSNSNSSVAILSLRSNETNTNANVAYMLGGTSGYAGVLAFDGATSASVASLKNSVSLSVNNNYARRFKLSGTADEVYYHDAVVIDYNDYDNPIMTVNAYTILDSAAEVTGKLDMKSAVRHKYVTAPAGDYTVTATDYCINLRLLINATDEVTLPSSASEGDVLIIAGVSPLEETINIASGGGDLYSAEGIPITQFSSDTTYMIFWDATLGGWVIMLK